MIGMCLAKPAAVNSSTSFILKPGIINQKSSIKNHQSKIINQKSVGQNIITPKMTNPPKISPPKINPTTFGCKAILFDMDGVLIDSTAAVARVWRQWALDHNLDPEYVVEKAHGRRSLETLRLIAPELDADQENLTVERLEIADTDGLAIISGAAELLRSLPPERFTIVTSATRALAVARLTFAQLPLPKRFITSDDVTTGKPSPEPYLKGAELLGFSPVDCLVFEDAPAGIEAAKAAGMQVIALTTTYPATDLFADAVIASFADIHVQCAGADLRVDIAPASHMVSSK